MLIFGWGYFYYSQCLETLGSRGALSALARRADAGGAGGFSRWGENRKTKSRKMRKARLIYGCFLKWWYPATIGFPTKNDHFGV